MNKKNISLTLAIILFTACGGGSKSSSTANDGKGSIDFVEYLPNESMRKNYLIEKTGEMRGGYEEEINVNGSVITTKVNDQLIDKTTYNDTNITITDFEENISKEMYRHVDIGDTLFSKNINNSKNAELGKITKVLKTTCTLKSKENTFELNSNRYSGDLLKIECIDEGKITYDIKPSLIDFVQADLNGTHDYYDLSYVYMKKGLGKVVSIDENCFPNEKIKELIDDRIKECVNKISSNKFYLKY